MQGQVLAALEVVRGAEVGKGRGSEELKEMVGVGQKPTPVSVLPLFAWSFLNCSLQ